MGNSPSFQERGLIHCLSKTFKELTAIFMPTILLTILWKKPVLFGADSDTAVKGTL
jgi:hypothetical protein